MKQSPRKPASVYITASLIPLTHKPRSANFVHKTSLFTLILFLLPFGIASPQNNDTKSKIPENIHLIMTMHTSIRDNWVRPPNKNGHLATKLHLSLTRDGKIKRIELTQSSGDDAFDRSAINAVRKASPFTFFQELDTDIYEKKFKTIDISFH